VLPTRSLPLIQDFEFGRDTRQVLAPLESDGVEGVILETTTTLRARVEVPKSELDAFDVPELAETQISDTTRPVALRPVSVPFVEGNKWRVFDGEQTFFAEMTDLDFLNRVMTAEESFTRGDLMVVDLRTRQFETRGGGLRTEHSITRVHEHRPGPRQVPLPLDFGQDGDAGSDSSS
jgi:hypothetical protein